MEDRTLLSAVVATTTSNLINDIIAANNGTGPTTIQLQAADATNGFDFTSAYPSTNDALPQITANITITGTSGFDNTIQRSTASGTPAFRLLEVTSGGSLTLQNLTLTGGLAREWHGGGRRSHPQLGGLTLSSVTVSTNMAQGARGINGTNGGNGYGGALYVAAGTATLNNNTTVSGNQALGGDPGVTSGTVFGNVVGGNGGAASGGGLYVAGGVVTVSNATLSTNQAVGGYAGHAADGGFFLGSAGAAYGGCLYVAAGNVTLTADTLSSNVALGGRGASAGLSGTKLGVYSSAGGAASGGGLYAAGGTVSLDSDALNSNVAQGGTGGAGDGPENPGPGFNLGEIGGAGAGGGLFAAGATLSLNSDTLSSNIAQGGAGGAARATSPKAHWAAVAALVPVGP